MDMHSTQPNEALFVPELIDLPVHPETRTDQKTIDAVLRHLWKNRPDLVAELGKQERRPVPDSRDAMHRKASYNIGFYLREEATKEIQVPSSRLGLLDVLFEMSRRLRKAQGLKEVPIFGKPLAPNREGPFPDLINKEISRNKAGEPYFGATQEIADKICSLAYKKDPQLMFDYCEQERRLIGTHEIAYGFNVLISEVRKSINLPDKTGIGSELHARLVRMCEIPTYEEMKKELQS
jgi:hypothetical protein